MKRRNAFLLFTALALLILVLDRVTKLVAVEQLTNAAPVPFIPGLLDFILVYNRGGAFGLFEGGGILFVIVAIIAVAAILVYLMKARTLRMSVVISLSMITAGALGNAYDRAADGAVPDFIHTIFMEFPVFNVADMALTLGEIILLAVLAYYWFMPDRQQKKTQSLPSAKESGSEDV